MNQLRPRYRYLIWGAAFGLCFPIVATIIELVRLPGDVTFSKAIAVHGENPLLLIIDTAPFFLGLFSYGIGVATESLLRIQQVRRKENTRYVGQLEHQNRELAELNAALDALVYTASHDLKTPLINFKSMLSMLETLLAKPGSEAMVREVIDRMRQATLKMDITITDLLDISRVEANFDGEWERIRVKSVLNDLVSEQAVDLAHKAGEVEVEVGEDLELFFPLESLRSLFSNLISNAIKYSAENRPPRVTIAANRLQDHYEFLVRDNGRGIDLDKHGKKLFRMFKQLQHGVEGSGIGLYVVKRIVDQAGGTIAVESTVDQGTTFRIHLPKQNET